MKDHSKESAKIFPAEPDKTYGLMSMIKGSSPLAGKEPEDTVFTCPNLLVREIIFFLVLVMILTVISLIFNAPLEELANPAKTPNPAKAPWYFLGLQEMLHYFPPFIAGVALPGLLVTGFILLPYIDNSREGSGEWFSSKRKTVLILFTIFFVCAVTLTIIGCWFRGPGWMWVWPWEHIGHH